MPHSPVIRIFSDLHLGHPGCRIDSVEQLRPLLDGAGRVIFNGDTYEQRHRRLVENGTRLFGELNSLLEELGVDATYLTGNHDPGITENHALDLAGGRVFVSHGDTLFRHLSPWSPKIRKVIPEMESIRAIYGEDRLRNDLDALFECAGRCRMLAPAYENEFRRGAWKNLRTALRFAWPPHRPAQILSTWINAPGAAHRFARRHRPEASVFLFGHTHFPGIWKKPERTVINTGGFLSMLPARAVEIRDGTLTCHKIDESPDGFRLGKNLVSLALR